MGNLPLHPVVVHLPLVLAVFLPVVVLAILWADVRGRLTRRAWWVGVTAGALLTGSAFVALKTGENEEERVERIVAEAAIETHEERAAAFLWSTAVTLVLLAGVGLLSAPRARHLVAGAAVLASVVAGGLAVAVGHSGGTLVYVHNAGAAYVEGGAGGSERATLGGDVADRDGDDDRDDRGR